MCSGAISENHLFGLCYKLSHYDGFPFTTKERKITIPCSQALSEQTFSIRFVALVIGKIISSLPGVELGQLHYRGLERAKIRALTDNHDNYEAHMSLTGAAREDLQWWKDNIMTSCRNIRHPSIACIFQTDASQTGWGITFNTDNTL